MPSEENEIWWANCCQKIWLIDFRSFLTLCINWIISLLLIRHAFLFVIAGRQKDSSLFEPIIRTANGSLILREEEELSLGTSLQMKPRNLLPEASEALLSDSDSGTRDDDNEEGEEGKDPLIIRPSRPYVLQGRSFLPAGSMALATVFLTAMVCLFGVVVFWYCKKMRAEESRRHKVTMKIDSKQIIIPPLNTTTQQWFYCYPKSLIGISRKYPFKGQLLCMYSWYHELCFRGSPVSTTQYMYINNIMFIDKVP